MTMQITEATEILSKVIGRKDIKLSNDDRKLIGNARKCFINYYKDNPKQFIEDFIRIIDGETSEEVPFKLKKAQAMVIDKLHNRFIAVPKARQLGMTTLTNALALHHCLFIKNASAALMAVKNSNAEENLSRIKQMFATIPKWVQELLVEYDEKGRSHRSTLSIWTFRARATASEAKMEVFSAASEDSTRGKHITFWHWTETAFSDVANEVFTSAFPSINRKKNSVIIMESTGNGTSGFYYDVCTGKRKGFEVIFLPWYLDDGYTVSTPKLSDGDRDYIADLMGVEQIPDYLTDGQLKWFQQTSELQGKAKTQQEYPINVEQVFQATNSSFFSTKAIQKLATRAPVHCLSFEHGYLNHRERAPGEVFEKARVEKEYIIVCDPSEGAIDPSVITIVGPEGEEVLFWREKLPPEEVVDILNALGRQYNDARIVVESNGIGQYILRSLISHKFYPNVHREDGNPGIRTDVSTKPMMLALLQEAIIEDKIKFFNNYLADEMKIFSAETLKAEKGDDNHDDVVMASAIAAYIFKYHRPRFKVIEELYSDYSYQVGERTFNQRKFII